MCTTCFYRPGRMWEADDLHLGMMGKRAEKPQGAAVGLKFHTRSWNRNSEEVQVAVETFALRHPRGRLPPLGMRPGMLSPEPRVTHCFPVKQACEWHFSETVPRVRWAETVHTRPGARSGITLSPRPCSTSSRDGVFGLRRARMLCPSSLLVSECDSAGTTGGGNDTGHVRCAGKVKLLCVNRNKATTL